MAEFSNAEKLLAVVELWANPRISQLPAMYRLLSPVAMPVLKNFICRIPDDAIPQAATAIINNAVNQGTISFNGICLDQGDLLELQKLIKINLPCADIRPSGYEVKLK